MLFKKWIVIFYEAQGYEIRFLLLFQTNESAINMEINVRESCTGNSIRTNIRHYLNKDSR